MVTRIPETIGQESLTGNTKRWGGITATVVLAGILWFVSFAVPWGNFWLKISVSVVLLAGLSFLDRSDRIQPTGPTGRDVVLGVVCAALLYLVFWGGQKIFPILFPAATDQIGKIYARSQEIPDWMMVLLALCVTGPGEEIYWRRYLQGRLMAHFGDGRGWLMATLLYGAVHIVSLNPMVVAGATVAGAFWGGMYLRFGRLWPVILCHALWSGAVFWMFPLV
jgi:hypothetical protein